VSSCSINCWTVVTVGEERKDTPFAVPIAFAAETLLNVPFLAQASQRLSRVCEERSDSGEAKLQTILKLKSGAGLERESN